MDDALRLGLATLFAWAGIAKLVSSHRFTFILGQHGIPVKLRPVVAALLAGAEMWIAVWLASGLATTAVAWAAAAVSLIVMGGMVRARLQGHGETTCGVFGGTRSRSAIVLAIRSAVIAAAAVVLALGIGGSGVSNPMTPGSAMLSVLGVLIVGLVLAVLVYHRQLSVRHVPGMHRTPMDITDDGPGLGEISPGLSELTRVGPEIAAFVTLADRACIDILPALRAIDSTGTPVRWVREDEKPDVFDAWNIPGTPYLVYLVDGVVRSKSPVSSVDELHWLIDTATGGAAQAA